MTRAFNNQAIPRVIMPRLSLNALVLCWTGLLVLMVRADLKEHLKRTQVAVKDPVLCECEFFVQSWKTSHMIRLPMGIEPVRRNSSQTATSELCVVLCQNQLPPFVEDDTDLRWPRIFKGACRTLLVNEYTVRHGSPMMDARTVGHLRSRSSAEPVRGCLQAYARSADNEIWVPMGLQYRKLLSCSHPRHRRSLKDARKMSFGSSLLNSVDAQAVVDSNTEGLPVVVQSAPTKTDKKPFVVNPSPIRMLLKQFGLFGPVMESLVDMLDGGGWREVLNAFRLGSYVDRYQRLAENYAEEFDAGHCFMEYLTYTVFNNRFTQRDLLSSSRGLEEDAVGFLLDAATNFLKSDNASQVISSLFSKMPSKAAQRQEAEPIQQSPPDIQEVAMSIARFYLRNYFSTLTGSTVRMDDQDPTNNPESLADMIEQVSRPVFLSVFGVVPGVPASGKLDHLLQTVSNDKPNPEWRNKLVPLEPVRTAGLIAPFVKTGNPFFDFGNQVVATFQRASDATHGLYCVKQYAVNRMWDGFRGSMRKMMRAIPSAG